MAHVKKVMDKNPSRQISLAVENMLKTGRLVTQSGLDLQQVTSWDPFLSYYCYILETYVVYPFFFSMVIIVNVQNLLSYKYAN